MLKAPRALSNSQKNKQDWRKLQLGGWVGSPLSRTLERSCTVFRPACLHLKVTEQGVSAAASLSPAALSLSQHTCVRGRRGGWNVWRPELKTYLINDLETSAPNLWWLSCGLFCLPVKPACPTRPWDPISDRRLHEDCSTHVCREQKEFSLSVFLLFICWSYVSAL